MSPDSIALRCLYFASLKEAAGTGSEQIRLLAPATVEQLLEHLEGVHPALEKHRGHYQVAVQQEIVGLSQSLQEGDEVALLPPVSGGAPADSVRLLTEEIRAQEVLDRVLLSHCGAVVLFLGTVRDFAHSQGAPSVERIDYSAYEAMAQTEMHRLVTRVREKMELGCVALWHRLGSVAAGEVSVAVAVSSCHRDEAFEASRWLIDQLKASVPVWKKEIGPSGEVWIEGDARLPGGTRDTQQASHEADAPPMV